MSITLLTIEVARILGVSLDDMAGILIGGAVGGSSIALPSLRPIRHTIVRKGSKPIFWDATVYFAQGESAALISAWNALI